MPYAGSDEHRKIQAMIASYRERKDLNPPTARVHGDPQATKLKATVGIRNRSRPSTIPPRSRRLGVSPGISDRKTAT
jgi:hypothetical protein